jgi:hypothetical protein
MARKKGAKMVPLDLTDRGQDPVNQTQTQSETQNEQTEAPAQSEEQESTPKEEYVVEDAPGQTALPTDAGTPAQGLAGKKTFVQMRQQTIEEQGVIELNSRTPVEKAWKSLKHKNSTNKIEDIWSDIDEEEAPMPNFNNPSRFDKYPESFLDEMYASEMNEPAYLLAQLQKVNKQYVRLKEEAVQVETQRDKAYWDRRQSQKKSSRCQSFARHALSETRELMASSARDWSALKRAHGKLDRKILAVRDEQGRLESMYDEVKRDLETGRKEFELGKHNLERVRTSILNSDEDVANAIRDMTSEFYKAVDMHIKAQRQTDFNIEAIGRNLAWTQKKIELSSEERRLAVERDQTEAKLKATMESRILQNEYEQGVEVGNKLGRRITAVAQYNRGYYWGEKNATRKDVQERLDEMRIQGQEEGTVEAREHFVARVIPLVVETCRKSANQQIRDQVAQVESQNSRDFATFMNERSARVRESSAAWATWKAVVTHTYRGTNEPRWEKEENQQAARIAKLVATDALDEVVWKTSPWRLLYLPESPWYMHTKTMKQTAFYKSLMPKILSVREAMVREQSVAKTESIIKARAKLDAQHAALDADRAAREPTDHDYIDVEGGWSPDWPPNGLPPVIQDDDEGDEAVEFSVDALPKAWWKPLVNPFTQ